jgi:hypothetical protein
MTVTCVVMTQTSVAASPLRPPLVQPIEGGPVNPLGDAQRAAELPGLQFPSSVPWYHGGHTSGADRVLHAEPAFCVLPGSPRPALADKSTDGGPW